NKDVTWETSDEKVAKVDENGKVIAVAAGKAIITVTTKDGNFKATSDITVKSDKEDGNNNPGEDSGNEENSQENIIKKIEEPDGKNKIVIKNPSNELKVEIRDIEAIKTGNGSLEIKNGEHIILLPFSIIDKNLLKEGSSIILE
ncbi:Ig-like domain-containing protein, partial [Clostridium perfringens]|uniref:Ig-like domain-containing protein n=1 Tax=Clostridium perfringens TaxID=1502 RepID=UPI002AC4022C